jgi:hypothetical protein
MAKSNDSTSGLIATRHRLAFQQPLVGQDLIATKLIDLSIDPNCCDIGSHSRFTGLVPVNFYHVEAICYAKQGSVGPLLISRVGCGSINPILPP